MKDYLIKRQKETIPRYGLLRRTRAVMQQLEQFITSRPYTMLDIGTADGLMLDRLKEKYKVNCFGLDYDLRYLKSAQKRGLVVIQADGKKLPLCDNSFDIVISTAVFKHISGLEYLVAECHRVIKPSGKSVVIDPTPLGIYLGRLLGHFSKREIAQVLSLGATQKILVEGGFKIITAERFMLTPFPFIGSEGLEKKLKQIHLTMLFFDYIIYAECIN